MSVKTKFSDHGLNREAIVDIAALSQNARYKVIKIPLYGLTLTNGVSHNLGSLGVSGSIVAARLSNRTVGAYTAATLKVRNATQALDATATIDPATVATGGAESAVTLAAAPPANLSTDSIVLVAAGTFTTQPVEMVLTLVVDPAEAATPINQ